MKHSNYHFSYCISINAPLECVWQKLIDVDTWHEWDTEINKARIDGEFDVNTNGSFSPKIGPNLNFYISECIPFESYTFNAILPVGELVVKRTLEPENDVVYFTDDVKFTGLLKEILGMVLGRSFKKVLPTILTKFKELVEY
jgi:hypothetical protein